MGGSLGGMQALSWTIQYPERIAHCVAIASAPKLSAQNIAFNEVARTAIRSDPDFHGGDYYAHATVPKRGLRVARMIGHITYLSGDDMAEKFGRAMRDGRLSVPLRSRVRGRALSALPGRQVLRVLRRQYLPADYARARLLRPGPATGGDLAAALAPARRSSCWRVSPPTGVFRRRARARSSRRLINNGRDVAYAEIDAPHGHDAFLLDDPRYHRVVRAYFDNIAHEAGMSSR